MPLRLILVHGAQELRAELVEALGSRHDVTVVGEAGDHETAISLSRAHEPDLIVLDQQSADAAGSDLLSDLRAAAPGALVVVYGGTRGTDRTGTARRADAHTDAGGDARDVGDLGDFLDQVKSRIPRIATMRCGPDAREVALSRRFVVDHCVEWRRQGVAESAAIVVSELVTNALVHVRAACELTLELRGDVLRIEVADHARLEPAVQDATLNREHGRGLLLVSLLCTAWGSEPRDDGKSVWAELHAAPSGTGTPGAERVEALG